MGAAEHLASQPQYISYSEEPKDILKLPVWRLRASPFYTQISFVRCAPASPKPINQFVVPPLRKPLAERNCTPLLAGSRKQSRSDMGPQLVVKVFLLLPNPRSPRHRKKSSNNPKK